MTDPREQASLRDQCAVFLTGHGPVRPAGLLASIPPDTAPDRYGDGGVVAELEAEGPRHRPGLDRELARHPGCPPGSVGRRGIPPAH